MSDEPIVSIEEFREITGVTSETMDNSVALDVINRLEALANTYISQQNILEESRVPNSTTPYCTDRIISHNKE